MRVKIALWFATLVLFLTAGWSGHCFAGSDLAGAAKDERATASVVTSKAANGGHFKTGQRMWSGTRWFYAKLPCSGKSVFVRQLRGPHLRT